MPISPPYRLVPVSAERHDDVLRLDTWAFPTSDTLEVLRDIPSPLSWDRAFAVEREGAADIAGFHATYPLRAYPVPGGEVSCGWLTWVGVHPSHRRRGILRGMIEFHLADCAAHGEAFSALTASEPVIYGRFGYGMASTALALTIPRGAALRPVAGSDALEVEIAEWDAASHGPIVAEIHRAYAREPEGLGRPGWPTRETPALRTAREADPPAMRGGREAQRFLVVRDAEGTPLAYSMFRRTVAWERAGAEGTVHVREAVGLTPPAIHRLWATLLDLDLTTRVKIDVIPVDDPIVTLLVDIRAAVPDYQDHTWIRIVDLPTALAERRYAGDVDVVLEVTDGMLPANAGRWHVRATAWGHANVEPTDAAPDLVMDIREVGAIHLGSTSLASLAQAGLVEVRTPRKLAEAAAAWSWPVPAGADWIF